jgi:hypothetical protein
MAKLFANDEIKIPADADGKVTAMSNVLEKSPDNDGSCGRHDLEIVLGSGDYIRSILSLKPCWVFLISSLHSVTP